MDRWLRGARKEKKKKLVGGERAQRERERAGRVTPCHEREREREREREGDRGGRTRDSEDGKDGEAEGCV